MIIYKITNLVNQKVYIGQTKQSLEKRWSAHKSSSNCIYLAKAIKKHSVSNFKIEQIDSASNLEDLNKKEEYWISFFNSNINGYNLTSGGDSRILSEKSKQKMSDSRKGKIMTENTRLALQNCNANKIISEEEKIRLRKINRDYILSLDSPRKITEEHQEKLTSSYLKTHQKIREYIKARGWTCNMSEAKRRLRIEVLTLLQQI